MIEVDYKNTHSIFAFCGNLMATTNKELRRYILSETFRLGLMNGPPWITFFRKIAPRFSCRVFDIMLARDDNLVYNSFDEFINHMLYGKDAVDPESAGGFNRNEFLTLVSILPTKVNVI